MTGPLLVTGATGFVGSAVVRELLAANHRVRALVRASSRPHNLGGLDIQRVTGDVRDAVAVRNAADGCCGVFHVAADYRLWVPDETSRLAMYATNVEGSRNVMQAAAAAGVRRIVYTSSVATLGLNADGTPGDEDAPVTLDDMIGDYKRSKYLAERAVRELAAALALDVVTVHPAAPVGPRDVRPTPTGRLVLDAARGRMPVYVDTGLDLVHVDDVARGHRLAWEKGRSGRHYILGGENLSLREILRQVAAIVGRHGPWLRVPQPPIVPLAHLAEAWARRTGREPTLTVAGARLARKPMYFSHRRASAELGYRPRPAAEALRDAVRWFAEHGYLRTPPSRGPGASHGSQKPG